MAHRVVTLLCPGVNPFEFAVACEVFGLRRPELGVDWYDHVLAACARPLVVNGGWTIDTEHGLEALAEADTVIVPASPTDHPPTATLKALQTAYRRGTRMVSFCTGAFFLAAAGILDGRPATTHWMHADELARRHPRVRVDPDVLYIDDGQVLTSAGTAGAIDLALHIVRQDYGPTVANQVARRMVLPPHREGGQAQYIETPMVGGFRTDAVTSVIEWMAEHLHESVTVPDLARLAAVSPRTFARRFREVTGTTPLRWLTHQRVARAQELLEHTDLPVDAVADRAGFGTAANLREHFRRVTGTTPAAYRESHRLRLPRHRDARTSA